MEHYEEIKKHLRLIEDNIYEIKQQRNILRDIDLSEFEMCIAKGLSLVESRISEASVQRFVNMTAYDMQ